MNLIDLPSYNFVWETSCINGKLFLRELVKRIGAIGIFSSEKRPTKGQPHNYRISRIA